ncbi:MAG: hypothetical protein ONB23_01205 [candidate division KSB1 bacterium]|nr:hypothetical protein [candidate division KSB1 bacterium]
MRRWIVAGLTCLQVAAQAMAGSSRGPLAQAGGWLSWVSPEGPWEESVAVGLVASASQRWGPFQPEVWLEAWSADAGTYGWYHHRDISVWSLGLRVRYPLPADAKLHPYLAAGPSLDLVRVRSEVWRLAHPRSDVLVLGQVTDRDLDLGLDLLAGLGVPLGRRVQGLAEIVLSFGSPDLLQLRFGASYLLR